MNAVYNAFTDDTTKAPEVQVICPESLEKPVSEQGINCGLLVTKITTLTYRAVLPLKDWARTVGVGGKDQDTAMAKGNRVNKNKALQTGSQVSTC